MRAFVDILGFFIILFGAMMALAGCLGATLIGPASGFVFWLGVIVMVIGWLISSTASKKTCPQCAEEVKHKALICKHCGHSFCATA